MMYVIIYAKLRTVNRDWFIAESSDKIINDRIYLQREMLTASIFRYLKGRIHFLIFMFTKSADIQQHSPSFCTKKLLIELNEKRGNLARSFHKLFKFPDNFVFLKVST